jgi:Zn-dependent protease with chaperone function
MRNLCFVLALAFVLCPALIAQPAPASTSSSGRQQPPAGSRAVTTPSTITQPESEPKVTAYTLSPELYRKAHNLGRIHFRFRLISFFYGLIVLLLILRWKLAPKYRDWAERFSSRRFLQSVVFSPLLLLTISVLTLPADLYEHWISRQYGLSVQGWGSWRWDWVKGELISIVIGIILIWLLCTVIRRSARRWWFYFWLFLLPIMLFVLFVSPWILDPLFHKFEPLQQKDPVLTASLERMVQRAREDIPPQRMFWMGAGEKTTTLNAYVTGFGASKRIVVWDTTIAKMNTPQIVFVTGHEMGHYVLKHIPKLLSFFAALFFVLFYLGFRSIGWVLSRWGEKWRIRALDDWASLPALLFLLTVFVFLASPLTSAVSRHYEHQADQYGLEVTHGLTADSGQVAAQAFQILGEVDLADPDPNPVNVFLFYSHPPISDRIQFCLTYDPWSKGAQGEFVK